MSDIRCPMCGKPNPEEAAVCAFCKARLRPVTGALSSADGQKPPTSKDEVDWLTSLRTTGESGSMASGETPIENQNEKAVESEPEDVGLPDWLEKMSVEQPTQETPPVKEIEVPDWDETLKLIESKSPVNQKVITPPSGSQDWMGATTDVLPEDKAPGLSSAENPDWLSNLRTEEEKPATAEEAAPVAVEAEAPDWLSSLGKEEEKPAEETIPVAAEAEVPDWLSNLRTEEEKPVEEAAPVAAEAEAPDWLSNLRTEEEKPVEEAAPVAAEAEAPDWLSSLGKEEEKPAEETIPVAAEAEMPGWLSSLGTEEEKPTTTGEAAPGGAEAEAPDWLSSLGKEEEKPVEEVAPVAAEAVAPDWLSSLGKEEEKSVEEVAPVAAEAETPDWLSSLGTEEVKPAEEAASVAAETEAPDWLSSLGTEEEKPSEETAPVAGEAETPDWLSSLGTEEVKPAEETASVAAETEAPDWLSSLGTEEEKPATAEEVAPTVMEAEMPDWLINLVKEEEKPAAVEEVAPPVLEVEAPDRISSLGTEGKPPAVEEAAPVMVGAEPPDWLIDLRVEEKPPVVEKPEGSTPTEAEMPDWLRSSGTEEKPVEETTPAISSEVEEQDWLGKIETEEKPPAGEETTIPAAVEAELPDWLNQFEETPISTQTEISSEPTATTVGSASIDQISGSPFSGENIDDWLTPIEEKKSAVVQEVAEETPAPTIEESTGLPEWLQAFKPIEAVPTGEEGQADLPPETIGPLTGLRGVLPFDEVSGRHGLPPVISAQVNITEKQAAHIAILDKLLNEELVPQPLFRERTQTPQFLVRLLVGIILIIVVIMPILTGVLPDLPQEFPVWVPPFYDSVKNLPEGAPVLIAVDYQPGFSSELKLVSMPVIKHLMERQARLIFISTVPAGQAIADDLLQSSLIDGYVLADKTVNLGYLAGGMMALKSFAMQPQQTAPYGLNAIYNGEYPWEKPVLQGITKINDFAMVIVVTDDVDRGRGWIEQVQPALGAVPLTMITSAQVAPMLRPYLGSGQVKGMVSGISEGTAYGQLSNQTGNEQIYWSSYKYGIILFIVLILLGGLFRIISVPFTRRKTRKRVV